MPHKSLFYSLGLFALTLSDLILPVSAQSQADGANTTDLGLPLILAQVAVVIGDAIAVHYVLGQLRLQSTAFVRRRTRIQAAGAEVHAPLELFLCIDLGKSRLLNY